MKPPVGMHSSHLSKIGFDAFVQYTLLNLTVTINRLRLWVKPTIFTRLHSTNMLAAIWRTFLHFCNGMPSKLCYSLSLAGAKYNQIPQSTPVPNDSSCLSSLRGSLVRVDFLSVLVVSDTWRWCSVSAALTGTDTVRELAIKF